MMTFLQKLDQVEQENKLSNPQAAFNAPLLPFLTSGLGPVLVLLLT
jgi:hypothetical protein